MPPGVCAAEENTAGAASTWREGFVRRADDHLETLALAEASTGTALDKFELAQAIRGLEEVPAGEKLVLLEYLDAVPRERLAAGEAFGWMSMEMLARRLGYSVSQVRRLRGSLERRHQLAYRHYDRRNSQAFEAGFDLRPLLVRAPELLALRASRIEALKERRIQERSSPTLPASEMDARARIYARHKQTPESASAVTVPAGKPAQNASALAADPRRTPDMPMPSATTAARPDCSPRGAGGSDGDFTRGSGGAETARRDLTVAWQLGRSLWPYVRLGDVTSLALRRVYDAIEAAIPRLLPDEDPERSRNSHLTWRWAVQRHGWRAIPMLVVAIEDPSVVKPSSYFGWLAKSAPGEIDLSDNLERIRFHQQDLRLEAEGKALPPLDSVDQAALLAAGVDAAQLDLAPGVGAADGPEGSGPESSGPDTSDPRSGPPTAATPWVRMLVLLEKRLGSAVMKHWLAALSAPVLDGDALVVTAPSKMHAGWVDKNYGATILRTAQDYGLPVRRLMVRSGQ